MKIMSGGLILVIGMAGTVGAFARGGDADLPDEIRALIKREEAKGLSDPNRRRTNQNNNNSGTSGGGGADAGCNLDIGNVNTGGKSGGGPRQVTTIITGPVIQMNNKCK